MKYTSVNVRKREGRRGWQGIAKYKDDKGDWHSTSRTFPEVTGKRQAEAAAREWVDRLNAEAEREANVGQGNVAISQTVSEFVESYIDGLRVSVEASTITDYSGTWSNRIKRRPIGSIIVGELTPADVRAWMAELSENYAPSGVRKAFVLLRSALKQGVRDGVLDHNATEGIKPPKASPPDPNPVVESQLSRLAATLAAAEQTPAIVGARISLYTGIRQGEVCALRWRDVDLQARTLSISTALGRNGGRFYLKVPKTGGSRRIVSYPESLDDAFKARRTAMMEEAMRAGVAFSTDMFVLGPIDRNPKTGDFKYMNPNVLWRKWRVLSDLLGLKGTKGRNPRFHDLRHTYATTAVTEHVDIKSVSVQLGHKDASMTLNIYADAAPDAKRRAAETVGAVLDRGAKEARGQIVQFLPTGTE